MLSTSGILLSLTILASWILATGLFAILVEYQRFWRKKHTQPAPSRTTYARVTVVIPCDGMHYRLRENLTLFLQQDHPNYEIRFVVESIDDDAVHLIRNLLLENRCVKASIHFAGACSDSGQRIHNLRHVTKDIEPNTSVIVFSDSNYQPTRTWLRWLTDGVENATNPIVRTGMDWMVPRNRSIWTLLVCSINNSISSFFGKSPSTGTFSSPLLIGGSWAIHRELFERIGIREIWKNSLSDDLTATVAIQNANIPIIVEPNCLCASSVQFKASECISFCRRRWMLARKHIPIRFAILLATLVVLQLGFWLSLVVGVLSLNAGDGIGFAFLASSLGLFLVGTATSFVRQNMAKRKLAQWREKRTARKFDLVAWPVYSCFMLLMMCTAFLGRRIRWGRSMYFVGPGGQAHLISRQVRIRNDVNQTDKPVTDVIPIGLTTSTADKKTAHRESQNAKIRIRRAA